MDTATVLARRALPAFAPGIRLADGTTLGVRPTEPGDRPRVAQLLEQLSPHARYLRFLQAVPDVPQWAIDSLCRSDDALHAGRIALDPDGRAVAVGQFFVVPGVPEDAELALTIVPAYQRRGVGAALIGRLAATAEARGVEAFTYIASPANRPAIELMRSLGAAASFGNGLIYGRVPIERVHRVMRTAASARGAHHRAA